MRVSVLAIALTCLPAAGGSAARAEDLTADQLIANYIAARGGAERWRQVRSLEMTGTYSVISKRSPFTLARQRGDLYRLDYTMADLPAVRARDAQGPWMLNAWLQPEAGRVPEDPYKRQLERESLFPLLLLDYDEKGIEVELLGAGDVDGIATLNLEITLPDGQRETWYFDAETFLEVAIDSEVYDHTQFREAIRQRIFFDDFREVEGLEFPFQVDWEFGARLEAMTVDEVVINPRFDESRFALGALAAAIGGAEQATDLEVVAARLRQRGLESRQAFDILRSLTSEVGPRFAGTAGDRAAVEWAVRTMRRIGLENVRSEPVQVPRWVRGEEHGAIVSPFPQTLHLTALGGSAATPEGGLEAEIVEVASLEELAKRPDEEIRGRIVFVNQRMVRTQDGSSYGQTGRIRRSGAARAAQKGAVAVLIRSVGTGTHRFPHTGAMRYEEGIPEIPAAALAIPDADILETQVASGRPVRVRLRLESRRLDDTLSANVIGEVPGRQRPDEIVLLGAHLDSWDLGTGAVDDGSGCAIVLETARLLLELPERPRRTVRVVLFANEEFGLSGARAYAREHSAELANHVLALEADLGPGAVWRFRVKTSPESVELARRMAVLLAPLGITWHADPARGGADLIPLRSARVPMADLSPDATYYFDYHHTADDTLDKVDPADLAQNVAAYSVVAYWAAEMEERLGTPPAEEETAPGR